MHVLFIGATGLVGSHTAPRLAQKFDLTLTGIKSDQLEGMEVLPLDITNWEAVETLIGSGASNGNPFDAVIYCATADYHNTNMREPEARHHYYEKCIDVNMYGIYHVFEAAWRARVPRIVNVSSMTAVMGQPRYEYIDKNTPNRANDLYAATKIFGEDVGYSYAFRAAQFGETDQIMRVLSLRLGQPYIDEEHWLAGILRWRQWREKHNIKRRKRHRHIRLQTHLDDVAQAMECALSVDVRYGIYPIISEVEDSAIDPHVWDELGYKPRWRFLSSQDKLERVRES